MIKTVSKIKNLKGEITIPADKSVSHRAVMLASIAGGCSRITNFSDGADCHSTVKVFKQLGAEISFVDNKTLLIKGGQIMKPKEPLDAGNSGTTMRLVSGILAGQDFESIIIGDESLSKRPMKRIIEPLKLMGADISSMDGKAPLYIRGCGLHGIEYEAPIASAQVKSCVLLAGLNRSTKGVTHYKEIYPSRNHTELMLEYLGANIKTDGTITIVEPSRLQAKDIDVIGDISSAAFFIVAGLIVEGSDFVIKNVGINPTRTGILDIIKRMNGNIQIINERKVSGEDVADIRVKYSEELKSCEISGADIPRLIDELPIIAVLASRAEGETIVKDAHDLRNKETDRISCLVKELQKIGVDIFEQKDGFVVHGGGAKCKLSGDAELQTYHDHRLAMSFYIAGLICEKEVAINGFEWINISFPNFEQLVESLI
ncbi:MAG: 3-phosphoshikimate 1-carboxyvinyltransferase [Cyanobacteria bacterium SIG31]|nr:3-phosphoshikimate 1-carboxyvinyltransferase [Cyanobacteria bacterium SIG31]